MSLLSDHPHMEAYYVCAKLECRSNFNRQKERGRGMKDKDMHEIEHMEPMLSDLPGHSTKRYSLDHPIPHPASHHFKRHTPGLVWTHGMEEKMKSHAVYR